MLSDICNLRRGRSCSAALAIPRPISIDECGECSEPSLAWGSFYYICCCRCRCYASRTCYIFQHQ
ncbi:hypothetical protein EMPG_09299 [Blastomyces silverae]|uniref:Uncharacterized protein n=1 Tax=Blastomyces silverae TaxID=2060906 RepID=A0A0H1B514_9EURO|nr:hypothetical protein EMPG_09299 [Blastomyces silverae]